MEACDHSRLGAERRDRFGDRSAVGAPRTNEPDSVKLGDYAYSDDGARGVAAERRTVQAGSRCPNRHHCNYTRATQAVPGASRS
jgi:hypothetical protein